MRCVRNAIGFGAAASSCCGEEGLLFGAKQPVISALGGTTSGQVSGRSRRAFLRVCQCKSRCNTRLRCPHWSAVLSQLHHLASHRKLRHTQTGFCFLVSGQPLTLRLLQYIVPSSRTCFIRKDQWTTTRRFLTTASRDVYRDDPNLLTCNPIQPSQTISSSNYRKRGGAAAVPGAQRIAKTTSSHVHIPDSLVAMPVQGVSTS